MANIPKIPDPIINQRELKPRLTEWLSGPKFNFTYNFVVEPTNQQIYSRAEILGRLGKLQFSLNKAYSKRRRRGGFGSNPGSLENILMLGWEEELPSRHFHLLIHIPKNLYFETANLREVVAQEWKKGWEFWSGREKEPPGYYLSPTRSVEGSVLYNSKQDDPRTMSQMFFVNDHLKNYAKCC